jgi:hypothetical protein
MARTADELARELRSLLAELAEVDAFELSDLQLTDAVRDVFHAGSMLDSVTASLTGEADERRTWAGGGNRSCSAWLGSLVRRPVGECRDIVRRARRLRRMPATSAAHARGLVATAHVDRLARAAKVDHAAFLRDEALLVDHARTLRFDDFCRTIDYWCQLHDPDGCEAGALDRYQARSAHLSTTLDGTGALDATFEPVGLAEFGEALRRIEVEMWQADWAEARDRIGSSAVEADLGRTRSQRRYDALIEMARRASAAEPGSRLPRPLITVLIDAPTLTGRVCELSTGAVVTPGEVLPLLCDADLERLVFRSPSRVLDVGERQRLFTGATRRAVEVRDRRCTHPTCAVPANRCDVDHIEPYRTGGPTIQTNGWLRCPNHHPGRRRRPPPNPDDEDHE